MKKTVLILTLAVLVVFSAFGASAEGIPPVENSGSYSYTVTCDLKQIDGINIDEVKVGESHYGLVAVKGEVDTLVISSIEDFMYIDQEPVVGNKVVEFGPFLPTGPSPDDESFEVCTLFIGGDGLDTATKIGVLIEKQDGVVISGTVVDTFAPAKTATITVKNSTGATIGGPVTAETNEKFEVLVPVGEGYTVEFKKTAYLTFTYTGVDVTGAVDLGEVDMSNLAGDVDETGKVETPDLRAILADFNKSTGLANENSDLDNSGKVETPDLRAILKIFNQSNKTQAFTAE